MSEYIDCEDCPILKQCETGLVNRVRNETTTNKIINEYIKRYETIQEWKKL